MCKRFAVWFAIALLASSACTGTGDGPPPQSTLSPSGSPTGPSTPAPPPTPTVEPFVLDVVATLSGPGQGEDLPYLDGMRVAVELVNSLGGVGGLPVALDLHDDRGGPGTAGRALANLLYEGTPAILYAGPGAPVATLRTRFAEEGTPVILLGGDLYSSRQMFRQVFQTTLPWVWQAHAIARYVVTDRKAQEIVFAGVGEEAATAGDRLADALEYWGGRLTDSFIDPVGGAYAEMASADWVVVFGSPSESLAIVNAIEEVAEERPGITGSASLLVTRSEPYAHPEPGTSASYTYTWAGWAHAIPRVAFFVERMSEALGRPPVGLEQEGFDAVRILVEGLKATGGAGDLPLVEALESMPVRTFSNFPISFGPDDHLFLPRTEVGLYAVPGPDEALDPWQVDRDGAWRAVMRTFTYNGERTSILDRDRRIFFPFWRVAQPGPEFWRSRYGIVTGVEDPLH